MMKKLVFLFFLFLSLRGFSQTDSLLLIFDNQPDRVMLKWLPGNYYTWMEGVNNGYEIVRHEVVKTNGKWKNVNTKKLNASTVMPWAEEKIKAEALKDPDLENINLLNAGKKLREKADNIEGLNDYAEIQNSKNFTFIMALFAQTFKNKAAEAMGTWWQDTTALPGKIYLYEVTHNKTGIKAVALVNRNKTTQYYRLQGFEFKNIHKAVTLYWLKQKHSGYVYYNIYRSGSKAGKYVKVNKRPYIGDVALQVDEKRVAFTDSFPELDKTYYYKVVGVNAFEKEGPPSAILEVEAKYFLQKPPVITLAESADDEVINLKWENYDEEKEHIKYFNVFHSSEPGGPFVKINEKPFKQQEKVYADKRKGKKSANYYTVCAYGAHGDSVCSFLKNVFLIDSIPPASPVAVSGTCDTNGTVIITWNKSPEADVEGYRVFRTYYSGNEPSRITAGSIKDTFLIDTVEVKAGYRKVYYGIVAIDAHFNASPISEFFEVTIPDFSPPSSPVFTDYEATFSGIALKWTTGGSEDIKMIHLLRKSEFEFSWNTILKRQGQNMALTEFKDTLTKSKVWYEYALIAEDSSGLKSKTSEVLRVLQPEKNPFPTVKNLQAFVSRENQTVKLTWDFDMNAKGFKILRSKEGKPVETYQFVPGTKREFYDKWLTANTAYSYAVVAEIEGGKQSLMSNLLEVKY